MPVTAPTPPVDADQPAAPRPSEPDERPGEDGAILEELLVEDVSIDGMCGVY